MEPDTDRGSLKRIYSTDASSVSDQSLIESYYKLKKFASGRTLSETPVAKQSGEVYVQNIPESGTNHKQQKLLSVPHDSKIKQGNNESQTSSNNYLSVDGFIHGDQDSHMQQGSVSSKVTHTNENFLRKKNSNQICGSVMQGNEGANFFESVTNHVHKQQQLFSALCDNSEDTHIKQETEEEETATNKYPSHVKFHGMSHGVRDVHIQQGDIISDVHYTPDVSLWRNEKANLAGDRSVSDSTPRVASHSVPRPFFPWGESGQGQILPRERMAYNTGMAVKECSNKYTTYQSMTIENRNSKEYFNPGYAALPLQTYSTTNPDSHSTLTHLIGKSVSDLLPCHQMKRDCEKLFPSEPDVTSAESNSGQTHHAHLLQSHQVETDCEKLFPSEPNVRFAESNSGQTHHGPMDRITAVDLQQRRQVEIEDSDIGQDNTRSGGSLFHLDMTTELPQHTPNSLLIHRQTLNVQMKAEVHEHPANSLSGHEQTLNVPLKTELPEHPDYSSVGQRHTLNVHMNTKVTEPLDNSSVGQKPTLNVQVNSEHAKIISHGHFSVNGSHQDHSNVKQEIQQRDLTLKEMCMKSQRGIFQFVPKSVPLSIADTHILIEKSQCEELGEITVSNKINYVYNPLEYAFETHYNFVQKFCNTEKKVLFLGMNPGPWGMSQNGVPFGESCVVRDWLKISGSILKPEPEHPKRLVTGLDCKRSEVSGSRFWGFFRSVCNTPETFFTNCFVYNMCPLAFMSDTGKNITPPQMESEFRHKINSVCDKALLKILIIFNVSTIVGVGKFACERAKNVLSKAGIQGVRVEYIMHPSPLNPAANKGWNNIATEQLQNLQLLDIVTNSC